MNCLQSRQRRRSKNQLMRGTLSYQRMATPQFGQWELGRTMDSRLGRREIQTLRKLPKRRPRTKPIASYQMSGITSKSIRRLEIDVHADGFNQRRPAILVVAGVIDVLQIERVEDAAPGVQVVITLENVLAGVVQFAVTQ